jgi:hypothetical protein
VLARRHAAPALAAALAVATVVLAVLLSRPPTTGGPPLPLDPSPPDRTQLSLDRCALALALAGRTGDYPERASWRPLARLVPQADGVEATVVEAPVPFVCVTGPVEVEVSDPAAAVPVGGALLLLTSPSGVVAATGPGSVSVEVGGQVGGPPPAGVFVDRAAPVGDPSAVAVVRDGVRAPPDRLAPPALRANDRRGLPADRSVEARVLLYRCLAAGQAERLWVPAVVLDGTEGGPKVLVVTGSAAVGGCVVDDAVATPVALWRTGVSSDGPRPFVWLSGLPDVGPDVAAGPAQPRVVRMEITAPGGATWTAQVGGNAFVTRVPVGVVPDPRTLTVRALDAEGQVLYTGPAAG